MPLYHVSLIYKVQGNGTPRFTVSSSMLATSAYKAVEVFVRDCGVLGDIDTIIYPGRYEQPEKDGNMIMSFGCSECAQRIYVRWS